MADRTSEYERWLDEIETNGVNLTVWEEEFIASLRDKFDRGRTNLSDTQADILERIYSERTP